MIQTALRWACSFEQPGLGPDGRASPERVAPGRARRESFATAAGYCGEPIAALDLYGNAITVPRFECNLILKSRRTAADVIRGIRKRIAAVPYICSGVCCSCVWRNHCACSNR